MSQSKVSIVLPTYNGRRYLAEAVRSCTAQSHRNLEIILVDDASTDGSSELLTDLARTDDRIRLVRHERNQKLPATLNTGFRHSTGDYLTWTSDDNIMHPDAIEVLLAALQQNPGVDFVYSDWILCDENGAFLKRQVVKPPERLALRCVVGPSFLYHRSVYEKVGDYNTELFLVEDYEYWLRVATCCRMLEIHECPYTYRAHGGSLTARKPQAIDELTVSIRARAVPMMPRVSDKTKAEAFVDMASLGWGYGHHLAALRYFVQAVRYDADVLRRALKFMFSSR